MPATDGPGWTRQTLPAGARDLIFPVRELSLSLGEC